ncbi:MAG: MFS transporter, partial [bacterium]
MHNLRAMWVTELMAIVGFMVIMPFLPLYLRELGVEGERQTRIWSGVVASAPSVAMVISAPIWGVLGDRHGRKVMVERAMIAGAVTMTLMGFVQNPRQLTFLRVLQGAFGGTVTASTALVACSVPDDRRGYALGTLQTGAYLGLSAGPLLGGLVGDLLGFRVAFLITGGLLFTAGMGVFVFVEEPLQRDRTMKNGSTSHGEGRPALNSPVWGQLSAALGTASILRVLSLRFLLRLGSALSSPT